jgi:hypothetical protein
MKHNLKEVEGREGLSYCTICKGAEGELTTDCCGFILNSYLLEAVYSGGLDYKDMNDGWYIKVEFRQYEK